MADAQQPVDQQVTSQTPATKQKNPCRCGQTCRSENETSPRGAEKSSYRGKEHRCKR